MQAEAVDGFRAETVIAVGAVEQALELTRESMGSAKISAKGARDVVTATDFSVEDTVRGVLGNALGLAVVGEERGGEVAVDGAPYWLVDPICGTRNFASGIPLYCVNLALVEGGVVAVAVVGDPSTGEVEVAERGGGAWSLRAENRCRLSASAASRAVVIEDSHAKGGRRERAAQFTAAVIRADRYEVRSLSTSLSLAYVATGRVAAYVLFWTSAVHAAAGSLLAAEAGAKVSDLDGRDWSIDSDSIVASATPELHGQLLDLAAARLA